MRDLNFSELALISGAGDDCDEGRETDVVPGATSEVGRTVNDGAALGANIADSVSDMIESATTAILDQYFGDMDLTVQASAG